MNKKTLLACALALAGIGSANAAVLTLVNMDPAGSGLNDPTAAAPVGGNAGTTIGQQRLNVYNFATTLWGQILQSNVETRVQASFQALACDATSAVLGSAGTMTVHANFTNAVPNTWYGNALANALNGSDVSPAGNEINSRFNSNLGNTGCLTGGGWYYGLDGNSPAGQTSFLDVVMHEIGHGLNFQGFYNYTTGAPFGTAPNNFPDIYSSKIFDNTSGLAWTAMTNAQRVTAATGGNLVWTGTNVLAQVPTWLGPKVNLYLLGNRPANFEMVQAAYGPPATPANFTAGVIVRAKDPTGGTSQGCAAWPAGTYTGKTVLIDRGTCSFKAKTLNAQNAGAAKVIIANNVPAGYPGMGDDPATPGTITIPSIGVTQATGTALKKNTYLNMTGRLQAKPGQFAGTDPQARPYVYAPNPVSAGSTFSHFDVTLTPNVLMEPFATDSLNASTEAGTDLTPAAFQDLGWTLTP